LVFDKETRDKMITMVEKNTILIKYYREGKSKSEISRILKVSRKTIRKYIEEHEKENGLHIDIALEKGMDSKPKYKVNNRNKRKLTEEMTILIKSCIKKNEEKRTSGRHKQLMKKVDIHEYLQSKGYGIGYTTVCNYIRVLELKSKEAYIKQLYKPGEVCEFDWGEVKLIINGIYQKINIAVFTSAYSNHRYAKLFMRQDSLAFSQSHIDYFSSTGGVHKEMVYDNMRVAVARFVGSSEERATAGLLEMSNYYKFGFRFCNIRKGNEKGHVERSVEYIRRKAFCLEDEFESLEQANNHLLKKCNELNKKGQKLKSGKTANAMYEEESKYLYKTKVPYISFKEEYSKVDKYSTIIVYGNRYSVPDHMVSKLIGIKVFAEKIDIYYNEEHLCSHQRSYKRHSWTIKIDHYLRTLKRKPGALKGSLAFAQLDEDIKYIYHKYFQQEVRSFVELLQYCKDKDIEMNEIKGSVDRLQKLTTSINKDTILAMIDRQKEKDKLANQSQSTHYKEDEIEKYAKKALDQISALMN
jgi:transposase/biotin operon repressor